MVTHEFSEKSTAILFSSLDGEHRVDHEPCVISKILFTVNCAAMLSTTNVLPGYCSKTFGNNSSCFLCWSLSVVRIGAD